MSDYISKSALIEALDDKVHPRVNAIDVFRRVMEVIENQPTLDEKEIIRKPMELILARLKGIVVQRVAWYGMKDDICRGVDKAIKIVKEECGINE